jgi:hypothetical protein
MKFKTEVLAEAGISTANPFPPKLRHATQLNPCLSLTSPVPRLSVAAERDRSVPLRVLSHRRPGAAVTGLDSAAPGFSRMDLSRSSVDTPKLSWRGTSPL